MTLLAPLSSCSSDTPPADPHAAAVRELFDVMDMPAVHPEVVSRMIEARRRELSARDTAGAARLEELADYLAWDAVESAQVAGFQAFLTLEELEELTTFFGTDLGGRLKARLPDLLFTYVENEPGAEGREQLARALSPFTDAERAQMNQLLGGQLHAKLGIATFSAYARSMLQDRSR